VAAGSIVHNFLFIAQVSQVSAHYRPKFFVRSSLSGLHAVSQKKKNDDRRGEFYPKDCHLFFVDANPIVYLESDYNSFPGD
jgi:hypothetical protein